MLNPREVCAACGPHLVHDAADAGGLELFELLPGARPPDHLIVTTDSERKLRWFDEGAATLRAAYDRRGMADQLEPGDWYGCPCCLTTFDREAVAAGDLTAEDVPPKSVGGRRMLLTCRECNNTAGELVDVHAANRQLVMDFARRKETKRPLPATTMADGVPMRGIIQWDGETIQMFGVPEQNNPRVVAEHLRILDSFVDNKVSSPPMSLEVHYPRYDGTVANLSYIRAAYLSGFAVFGWPYILNPIMEELREQLRNPDSQTVPIFVNVDPTEPDTTRRILLASDPDDLACLAVTMGPWTVFLPSPFRLITLTELAKSFDGYKAASQRPTLHGKLVPWPNRPQYWLP